jgi:hypothetical protein
VSRPSLGPTQPPVQWVEVVLSLGVNSGQGATLTTHCHLVLRSRMSKSYTSSPPQGPPRCRVGQLYFYFYKVQYCVHKSPTPVPIPSHINLNLTPKLDSPKMHFNSIFQLCLGLLSGLFPSGFQIKISYTFLISPMHTTCPTHLTLLQLNTLIIFGEEYKYVTLHYAVFSNLMSLHPS